MGDKLDQDQVQSCLVSLLRFGFILLQYQYDSLF